jgi:hypothetical protein
MLGIFLNFAVPELEMPKGKADDKIYTNSFFLSTQGYDPRFPFLLSVMRSF